ncbi:MAG TPA: cytochrome P450 [Acidimicrobiia bacterium]|nr:cytochrome P450 [Acidimicrobiia bacterium]
MLPLVDNSTPAFAADPHGVLRRAREQSWIVDTPTGLGVLTYEGCNAVLVDPAFRPGVFELMSRATGDRRPVGAGRTLLGSEGADHQELRRVVMPWFTPRRIERLRAQTAALASSLVGRASGARSCEFMAEVARPIPPAVFCWMVGCDVERGPELAHWSAIALQAFSGDPAVMDDVTEAIRHLRRFADDLIEAKRAHPGDDITSALLAGVGEGVLTARDVRSLLTELLSASVDNTTHSMGLALWLLCRHPEQWAVLARDPGLLDGAIEECARFEPVIRHGNHVNDDTTVLLGHPVPAGTLVTVFLASAHRDPAVYDDPDRFDVTRRLPAPQLNFGIGRHYCIGAALARMEVQEVLRAVISRWTSPRLGTGVRVHTALSGVVDELPVEFGRRS